MKNLLFAGMVAIGTFMSGCGAVENAIDCNGICNRYQSCYDSKYDVGACDSKCRDNANSDKDYMNKANACHDCLGDKSCASATFNCGTQCIGIVP
jgi:hypothetical protein